MPGLSVVDVPGIDQYTAPQPSSLQDAYDLIGANTGQNPDPSPPDYVEKAKRAAARYGIDPDKYVRLINQESGFNPNAQSPVGALGLAQFMPQTAQSLGIDPMNPDQALDAGAKYLRQQIDYFGGDWEKGLAAYNAGAGNVQRAVTQGGDWRANLPEETKQYLSIINGDGPLPQTGSGLGAKVGSLIRPDMIGGSDTPDNGTPPLITQLGRQAGGFRDTETQTDPNANTSDPFALIGRAYNAVNPAIPYVTPAIENVVKPVAGAVANQIIPGGNLINAATGFNPGRTAADALIPSRAADIALTLAPEVGKVGEAADAIRGAVPGAVEAAQGAYRAAVPEVGAGSYLAGVGRGGDLERQVAEQAARDAANAPVAGQGDVAAAVRAARETLNPKSPEAIASAARDEAAATGARAANIDVAKGEWTSPETKAAAVTNALDTHLGGDTDVTLYRGINPSRNPLTAGTAADEGPGRWWSTDRKVAENYAGPNGQVLEAHVKASDLADPEHANPIGGSSGHEWTLSNDLQNRAQVDAGSGTPVNASGVTSQLPGVTPPGVPAAPIGGQEDVAAAVRAAREGGPPAPPSGGEPPVPSGSVPLPAGGGGRSPAEIAAQKLVTQVKMSEQLPEDTETARRAVRSQRAAQAYEAGRGEGTPEELARRSRSAVFQTGELPTAGWAPPQGNFTPEDRQQLFDTLNLAKGRIGPYRHGQAVDAVDKVLGGDYAHLTQGDMKLLTDVYGDDLGKAIQEKVASAQGPQRLSDKLFNAAQRGLANVSDAINAPISTATLGHAPIFRQGIGVGVTHPSQWLSALKDFYSVLRNPENLDAIRAGLDQNDWVLGRANPNTGYVETEMANRGIRAQDFTNYNDKPQPTAVRNVMAKLGIVGNRSQQAAAQYLDTMRKLVYADEAQRLWATGERDPREYQGIWDTISHATGVGVKESPSFNPAFSFKALTGRLKSLADPIVQPGGLNPFGPGARAVAVQNLIGIASFGSTIMALDNLTGGKANLDITAGGIKTKVGLTTIDPYAGIGPIIRMFANSEQAVQKAKNPEDAINKIGSQVYQFAHGQLSPGYEYIASLLTGKDWKDASTNPAQATKDLLTGSIPIAAYSIYKGIKDNYDENGLKAGVVGGIRSAGSLGALSESTTKPSRNDRLNDAIPELKQAGAIPNDPSIKSYQDLGGGESNAAVRWLEQNRPDEAARFKANRQAENSPYQAAQDKADAVQTGYAPKFDALYKSLLNGSTDPKDVKDLIDNYKHEILGNQAQIYSDKDYQKAVADLKPNDFRKVEDGYYEIAAKAYTAAENKGGKPDYAAIDKGQADYLAGLTPAVRSRLQNDLTLRNSVTNAPPIVKLQREVDQASQGYYDILGAQAKAKDAGQTYAGQKPEDWLAKHPQENVQRWLFYGDVLRSADAVDAALTHRASGPESQAAMAQLSNRVVKFGGLARNIAEGSGTKEAWEANKTPLTNYFNADLILGNGRGQTEARKLFTSTHDREYSKPLDQMDADHRGNVLGAVRQGLRERNPRLDAALLVFGYTKDGKARTHASYNLAQQMVQHFGLQRVADGYTITLAKDAK